MFEERCYLEERYLGGVGSGGRRCGSYSFALLFCLCLDMVVYTIGVSSLYEMNALLYSCSCEGTENAEYLRHGK